MICTSYTIYTRNIPKSIYCTYAEHDRPVMVYSLPPGRMK